MKRVFCPALAVATLGTVTIYGIVFASEEGRTCSASGQVQEISRSTMAIPLG